MSNWREENNSLVAEFTFLDFSQAWAFMNEVALAVERHGHHPNWYNVYNEVKITLTTHEEGNTITEKDKNLSIAIDDIFARYQV